MFNGTFFENLIIFFSDEDELLNETDTFSITSRSKVSTFYIEKEEVYQTNVKSMRVLALVIIQTKKYVLTRCSQLSIRFR